MCLPTVGSPGLGTSPRISITWRARESPGCRAPRAGVLAGVGEQAKLQGGKLAGDAAGPGRGTHPGLNRGNLGDGELWAFYFFTTYTLIQQPLPSMGSAQGRRGPPGGRAGNENCTFPPLPGCFSPEGKTEAPTRAFQSLGLSMAELGFEPQL